MPEVHALSQEGVVFTTMRSAAPWTYPSVISMFSGLYPQQHGANGSRHSFLKLSIFSPEVPLLPHLIKERYYTAAFVTNPFLHRWNSFHLGFDHFAIDEFIGDQGARAGDGDAVWTEHMFSDTVNATIREHFDSRDYVAGTTPEFTYVHYIDVHGPWKGAPFDVGDASYRETEDEAYGKAAGYVDQRIVELYRYFTERYGGDLVFAVTSDHGQELGDDLRLSHRYLDRIRKATVHDFNTRIPFLLLPSRHVPRGKRLDFACSNVDIGPTLLEWAEDSSPVATRGVSLLPAIRGEEFDLGARPIYSIRDAFGHHNDCVVLDDKKYMRYFHDDSDRLLHEVVLDLARDPDERLVIDYQLGSAERMVQRAARSQGVEFEAVYEEPDEELKSQLQDLGYLGEE